MKNVRYLILFLSAGVALTAQDLRSLPEAPPLPPPPAAIPVPTQNSNRVIVPALQGIRLVRDATAAATPAAPGIDMAAFPELAGSPVQAALARRLGQPLRFTDITKCVAEIQAAYSASGRPFVQIAVPPQDITSGLLTFVVVEAKLGAVKVQGAKWFSEASYREALHLVPGQPIDKTRLDADLDWLGRSGYRRVSAQAVASSTAGATDMIIESQEQRPWRYYAGYSDSGTATTDDERVFAGGSWGNAFGRGQELTYQLTTSPDLKTSVAHSGSYTVPINALRHIFSVDAAWSTIRADIPAPFDSKGYSWQVGLNYEIPLRAWKLGATGAMTHSFTGGFDVKETNNNIEFSNLPVTDNTTQILQFRANYQASLDDKHGRTSASLTGVFSPGGLTANNKDAAFTGSRSGAQADYAYLNLNLRRDTQLPHGFSHVVSFTGQIASANLLGSEQLGLGGAHSVRGYDEGLLYGDQGALLRNELYLPAFSLMTKWTKNLPRDSVRLLGFWDYGVVGGKHLLADEDAHLILSSVGVGLRYQMGDHFSAQFDYGWQQKDPGFPTRESHGRGHVNMTYSW